jgi:DNA primase
MIDTKHINILSIIGSDTPLKRVAAINGGEYAGPCPFCGGEDRFRVWVNTEKPGFWCRQCGRKGDVISYLQQRDNLSFAQALEQLRLNTFTSNISHPPASRQKSIGELKPDYPALADPEWQVCAQHFARLTHDCLTLEGYAQPVREYLYQRGINDEIINEARLGYNPCEKRMMWGHTEVWLPQGIVIPWWIEGRIWRITIRRLSGKHKYVQAAGGANGLYNIDKLEDAALLVEGEFDALLLNHAMFFITALATGSTSGAKLLRWVTRLALMDQVYIIFDNDEAGDKAAKWWLEKLPKAHRLSPAEHDITAMYQAGINLHAWFMNSIMAIPAKGA